MLAQHLNGHDFSEHYVFCSVDATHAPLANRREYFKAAIERFANPRLGCIWRAAGQTCFGAGAIVADGCIFAFGASRFISNRQFVFYFSWSAVCSFGRVHVSPIQSLSALNMPGLLLDIIYALSYPSFDKTPVLRV